MIIRGGGGRGIFFFGFGFGGVRVEDEGSDGSDEGV